MKARARKPLPGYQHRLLAAASIMRGVSHAVVEHDHCCAIFQRHPCNCVPDIAIGNGDTLLVVDAQGAVSRTGKQ